jgi:hypothetical protein
MRSLAVGEYLFMRGTARKGLIGGTVEVVAATRKKSFRYSGLCGMASDALNKLRSATSEGFKFTNRISIQVP